MLALWVDPLGLELVSVGAQSLEPAPPPTQEQGAAPELVWLLAGILLWGFAGTSELT